jgi:uncharacterized membrane protein YkoI
MKRLQSLVLVLTAAALAKSAVPGWGAAPPPPTARPTVRLDSARKTASARVPGARLTSYELEREHGRLIYSFEFKVRGRPGVEEVNVDARSGEIVAVEHEGPRAEHRERAKERSTVRR